MKKESILICVVSLVVGFLLGFLIGSSNNAGKGLPATASIPAGSGSPTDYTTRITEAEKIVAQDPKNMNAWLSLGNDYFDTEQAQKSIHAYGKVLEIEPNNPNVLTDQGVMYRKIGEYDKALANFALAQKADPNHVQSLFNSGVVYTVDLKDNVKARPYWKRILEIDPNSATAMQVKSMMQGGGGAPAPWTNK